MLRLLISVAFLYFCICAANYVNKEFDKCDYWASEDKECINNPNFMWSHCRTSCFEHAKDDNEKCKTWAEEGECTNNPNYINLHCPESCGFAAGWNPWTRRRIGIKEEVKYDEKIAVSFEPCDAPSDLLSVAETMRRRMVTYFDGGAVFVKGLSSSAPSEYLGMMGLAEAFLYTLRIYDSILSTFPREAASGEGSIDKERTAIKERISSVMHIVGAGYSSDKLLRALPTWIHLLNVSSDATLTAMQEIYGVSIDSVLAAATDKCHADYGPPITALPAALESEPADLEPDPNVFSTHAKLHNGVIMPLLGLGTWQLDGAECEEAVEMAINIGYRHIDSAEAYRNEGWAVRHAIEKGTIKREDIFLATKISDENNAGYEGTRNLVAKQLKFFQTDYIDLYMLHSPMQAKLQAETWRAMEELVDEGVLKAIGVSNFNRKQLEKLVTNSRIKPMVVQNKVDVYHVGKQLDNQGDEVAAFAQEHGIVVVAYSSFSAYPFVMMPVYDPIVRYVAANHGQPTPLSGAGVTPAQVILRWLLQHGMAVIPRSSNPERLQENFDVLKMSPLSKEEMDLLDALQNLVESIVSVAVNLKPLRIHREEL